MNGIYLSLLLKEIEPMVVNKFIHRVGIKERLIQIEFDSGSLFISLYPEALGMYVEGIISGYERLYYFDEHLSGSKVVAVKQIDFRPVFDLMTEKTVYGQKKVFKLKISLYKEAPNFIIISEEFSRQLFVRYVEKPTKPVILSATPEDLQDKESLIKKFEGIDKNLAQELNEDNLETLKSILKGKGCKIKIVSIVPLRISLFAEKYIGEYSSWNEIFSAGIKDYLIQKEKNNLLKKRQSLISNLEKKIEKLEKKKDDKEFMEYNRIAGELLITNLTKISKGTESVVLINPYTQQEINIKLDPAKNPRENAIEYFKRYKKLKRGLPKIEEQIKRLKKQIELLKGNGGDIKDNAQVSVKIQTTEKEVLPFRKFLLTSGSIVYVGKDAQSNMELTFKFARPDDYFFHVRGSEGAHTILKPVMGKGQNVRKDDIEMAAAIAAYFSKAKKQRNVPVSYTQRKYLKKSKRGKLGTVILMRENVVFVDPQLPANTKE
ncbi:MAG: NFACT RNA binding domain-containing protein [bacterium]